MTRRSGTMARRTVAFRLITIATLAVLTALVVLPRAVGAENPYSTLDPRTKSANDIQSLYKLVFWLALVVFVGVQIAIAYTVLRYRRRSEDGERPEQVHGNKTLEVAWTILPAIVLLIIFIPTVGRLYDFHDEAQAEEGDYVIEVYGKQWWWEVHYKEPNDQVGGIVTANEIHIPADKKVVFHLFSNNVIHSFWVPQLMGKVDLVPGHRNELGFTADVPGYYFGQCAEFCGDSHAWMQFKVIVQPQADFDAWVAAWKQSPAHDDNPETADVAEAPRSLGVCITCHRINGTNLASAPMGLEQSPGTEDAPGTAKIAGPNLTLFGCRTTLGAGVLDNTPENLAKWLNDPGSIKPGNYMATQIGPGMPRGGDLSDEQIQEIVDYLESLKPEGGCPPLPDSPLTPAQAAADEAEA